MEDKDSYTVVEVANILGCCRATVDSLIDCGDLEAIDIAPNRSKIRRLRITKQQLEIFMTRDGVYAPVER